MTFVPDFSTNNYADVYACEGMDVAGQAQYKLAVSHIAVAVINENDFITQTSPRAALSATHATADYNKGPQLVLFPFGTNINYEDIVVIEQNAARVTSVQNIYDLDHNPGHIRIRLESVPYSIIEKAKQAASENSSNTTFPLRKFTGNGLPNINDYAAKSNDVYVDQTTCLTYHFHLTDGWVATGETDPDCSIGSGGFGD